MNFLNDDMQRGLRRLLAGGLSLWVVGCASADQQEAEVAVEKAQAIAADIAIVEIPDFDDTDIRPGFMLPMADETVREQMSDFNKHLSQSAWGEAFRVLTELSGDRLDAMVPVGDKGFHLSVRELIQRQLLAMPVDGRRAFRLYFDGQAREMLRKVREHPRPGSDERLALAQRLVDRMLASSVGGEAAELLGDLYFERGSFARADRNWQFALEQGSASGDVALRLQVKRVWALHRGGNQAKAADLFAQLRDRYGNAPLRIGGQEIDAIAQLEPVIDQDQPGEKDDADLAGRPLRLPANDALPAWNLPYLSDMNRSQMLDGSNRSRYYRGPANMPRHIPQVVADDQRVYFHYLGAAFALDSRSGKIVWREGSVAEAAASVNTLHQSTTGNPAGYQIALASDAVLITSTVPGDDQYKQMILSARDKQTGGMMWSSVSHGDWGLTLGENAPEGTSIAGQVLVDGTRAYAVVHPPTGSDYFLRRFDPSTGEVDWTVSLGAIDPIVFQNEIRLLPQPQLKLAGGELFVMTNNGVLLAVDQAGGQINWGMVMDTPFGVGQVGGSPFSHTQSMQLKLEAMANPNGSGAMIMQDGVLYAKQHYGSTLFAIKPETGQVLWSADKLDPDAKLVGIDDQRFYLASDAVLGYKLAGDHDLDWKSRSLTSFKQDQAGVLHAGDRLLVLSNQRLRMVSKENGDFEKTDFRDPNYLGQYGGRLYQFGDLLISIDRKQITAYRPGDKDNN